MNQYCRYCSHMITDDGKYHVVYGEKYDRKTKEWSWLESTPEEVIYTYL